MTDDYAVVPGRYGGPDMAINPAINNELAITVSGGELAFYNCLDVLEAILAAAWAADRDGMIEALSQARTRGFEVPQHLQGGTP